MKNQEFNNVCLLLPWYRCRCRLLGWKIRRCLAIIVKSLCLPGSFSFMMGSAVCVIRFLCKNYCTDLYENVDFTRCALTVRLECLKTKLSIIIMYLFNRHLRLSIFLLNNNNKIWKIKINNLLQHIHNFHNIDSILNITTPPIFNMTKSDT